MPTVRIDNLSNDSLIAELNGESYEVAEGEKLSVQNVQKGETTLRIRRGRTPVETQGRLEDNSEPSDFIKGREKNDSGAYFVFDGVFDIDFDSSKSVVTVRREALEMKGPGMDALASGFKVEVSGARLLDSRREFANERVRKRFISHHVGNAMMPVGFGGLLLLFVGLYAFIRTLGGKEINLGGSVAPLPLTIAVAAIGAVSVNYTIAVIVNTFATADKLKKK